MKIFGLIAWILWIPLIGSAQEPETVYSIAKEQREIEWYKKHEKLWLTVLNNDQENARAWQNYYEAIRAQWILSGWGKDSSTDYKTQLDSLVNKCYEIIPNSFAANYLMYRHFSNLREGETYIDYLEKAYEIEPYNTLTYESFITYYEVYGKIDKRKAFSKKAFEANIFASSLYNWAYNVLMELDENAILFTCGDNDTYPFWGLQDYKNIRPDVTILNTSLLTIDDYRNAKLKSLGVEPLLVELAKSKSNEEMEETKKKIIENIFSNTQNLPVYVSGTAVFQFQDDFSDDLYLTGLTYKYSEKEIDNISIIRRNYEKKYLLDYLTETFAFNVQDKISDRLNATYLPAFVKLYHHYKIAEDEQALQKLEQYLIEISKKAGQYDTIKTLIEG